MQDEERNGRGAQRGFGVIARLSDFILASLEGVDVVEYQHHAIDLVVQKIGAGPQSIPAAIHVAHLALPQAHVLDDLQQQRLERWPRQIVSNPAEIASNVARDQVKNLRGRGRKAPDGEVTREQQKSALEADLEVVQVGVQAAQLRIPANHLVVDRRQLFVRGLQFLLRGFQFLVDALQFLVGTLHLLARRLQLLVDRFILFLDGLDIIARFHQLSF